MDSGNSGSMSSSGDEEYDSVAGSFLNPHAQIGCFTASHPHSSSQLVSPSSHHPYAFDVSPTNYVHPNNLLINLEAAPPPRSDHQSPNCTVPAVSSKTPRNPKKRSRASRRAPTTVMTTDTTNFRAMVQEFTGIPAPPFSSSSYSRRLDLLAASSSFRSSSPYPLRPPPHKLSSINPSTLLSSSPSTLLSNHHNMGDATTTTTNANNNSSPSILNYQLIPNTDHDHLGTVAFNHPQHMSMQVLPFQTPNNISLHYPFPNSLPPSAFTPKSHSHPSLSNIPSLEDQLGLGMSRHPQSHLHLLTSHTHPHLSTNSHSDHQPTPQHHNIGMNGPQADPSHHHPFTSFPPTTCKLINFSASSSSSTFNLDDNNNNNNMDNSSAIQAKLVGKENLRS